MKKRDMEFIPSLFPNVPPCIRSGLLFTLYRMPFESFIIKTFEFRVLNIFPNFPL